VRYALGTPEYVYWPDPLEPHYPDQAWVALVLPNRQCRAYSAKGSADLVVRGPRMKDVLNPKFALNIDADPGGPLRYYTHDVEGVWFDTTTGLMHCWVHIETYTGDTRWFHGEITHSQSADGGITWDPGVYRQQHIAISSAGPYSYRNLNTGTGAHSSADSGNFLYIYWVDMWAEFPSGRRNRPGQCIARAPKSSAGRPGSWLKLYRGSFSEPGIGGRCTEHESLSGTFVHPVVLSNTMERLFVNLPPSFVGRMAVSTDGGQDWVPTYGGFLPTIIAVTASEFAISRTAYIGYNSLVEDENGLYWMYAMNMGSYESDLRNIVRFPIRFARAAVEGCAGRMGLTRWRHRTSGALWITWQPVDNTAWQSTGIVAYVSSCSVSGTTRVVDCSDAMDRHFIGYDEECGRGIRAPMNNGNTLAYYGSLGSILVNAAPGMVQFWRCFIQQGARGYYDVAVGTRCPQVSRGNRLLGFIIPPNTAVSIMDYSNGTIDSSDVAPANFTLYSEDPDPFYDPAGDNAQEADPTWSTQFHRKARLKAYKKHEKVMALAQRKEQVVSVVVTCVWLCVGALCVAVLAGGLFAWKRRRSRAALQLSAGAEAEAAEAGCSPKREFPRERTKTRDVSRSQEVKSQRVESSSVDTK